jgi:hypothetical protein
MPLQSTPNKCHPSRQSYFGQFKWTPMEEIEAKHILWTPDGMTQEQALQQLPPSCHRMLTAPPCACAVDWLMHLRACCTESGDHEAAKRIERCVVAANNFQARAAAEKKESDLYAGKRV